MKVTPEVKECIVKMAQAFEKDKIRGYPEFTNIKYRIASILGIGRSTVFRTLDDNRHYEGPVKDVVSSIHKDKVLKKKKQQSKLCKLDDFDISVIRRSIHAMSKSGKFISLRTLAKELESKDIKISPVTLKKYMNRNGFVFHKKHGKRFLHESGDIVAHRHSYLRQIRKFREEGLEVVYLDETWVNSNHACAGEWSENRKGPCSMLLPNCKECSRHIPSGKGSRLIVLDAGSSTTGFIPDVSLIFTSKTKSSDYHDEMNGQHFLEWFEYTLLPALPAPSVVVMDNAPYHNIKTDDSWYPKRSSNKTTIVQWLLNKNIQADESELKEELLIKVRQNKPEQVYKTDVLAMEYGHRAIRLPVRHCELNPIELIQGEEKMYVARKNSTFKLKDVRRLFLEARETITRESWEKAERHVIEKVENKFWETDGIQEEIAPFIITVDDESEDDDYDDDDDDDDDNLEVTDDNNNFIIPGPAGDFHGNMHMGQGEDNEEDEVQDEEEETLSEINSDDDSNEDEDVVCLLCNQRDPPSKSRGNTEWICSDLCDKWLHSYCNKIPFVDMDLFQCGFCKEKLSVGITYK